MASPRTTFDRSRSLDSGSHAQHLDVPALDHALVQMRGEQNPRHTYINDLSLRTLRSEVSPARTPTPIMPSSRAWRTLFSQEIAHDWVLEAQLMLMTMSTGILDATTYSAFQVFATKQTGNTLFLALYALDHPILSAEVEKNVAVSIGMFVLGAAFFGHLSRYVHQKRRAWLLASNLFQTLLLFAAAALRQWAPRSTTGPSALGVLALLGFASGGQIVGAVTVGMAELNTTMVTGTLVQLSNDAKLFHLHNAPRNRRVMFYFSLIFGCFAGVGAVRYRDAALGLLVAACVKAVASLSFFFNHGIVRVDKGVDPEKQGERRISGAATPISKILWGD